MNRLEELSEWTNSCPLWTLGAGAFAVFYASVAVYRLYFSPLRGVPGPWYTAVSELWLSYNTLLLRRCSAIHALHEKYGPVVRVAPNFVVFNDSATSKIVYGANLKLSKSESYKKFMTCVILHLQIA